MTFLPDDAPFSGEQRAWVAGFMAALRLHGGAAVADDRPVLHILYGSQTGNALGLADDLAEAAGAAGLHGRVRALDDVDPAELASLGLLTIITSTYGEGEMPDNAELFWQALSASGERLDGLSYGVLALGDTGYDGFCAAGELIDDRLAAMGAQRVVDRVDCDVDFDDPAATWLAAATARFIELSGATPGATSSPPTPGRQKAAWTRRNPFAATVAAQRLLSAPGSAKEIRHVEIALGDSGLTYEAGDALAVVPVNDPVLVEPLLTAIGATAHTVVDGTELGELLVRRLEISTPSRDLIAAVAGRSADAELRHVLDGGDGDAMSAWLWGRDVLDLVLMCDDRFSAEELVGLLRPLQHRAYSISSSPLAHPDTVHLTIAAVRHHRDGRDRGGVASTFLADRADGEVRIFVQPNPAFRVAPDDVPMIMIGPGTGVAPFRAFCQERAARGATGRSWLFFGDQHRDTDFVYADELLAWQESGVLERLDLAFSRDQDHKVYVQSRMREEGKELFAWLEDGAHLYVCGDASRMARDVDEALHDVVAEHGGLDADAAEDYVAALRRAKRYVRDVY